VTAMADNEFINIWPDHVTVGDRKWCR